MTDNLRRISFLGATSVGVGAIVGGGILALAGVAFATTGPSAIIAFLLNGIIALLTAFSFAELSAAFPQSGGTYTFSKRVLNVHTAFMIGWIVWFASIVAGVLYALGFAVYAVIVLEQFWNFFGNAPGWLTGPWMQRLLAIVASLFYTLTLMRKSSGGGDWATYGKVAVFGILIAVGCWAIVGAPRSQISAGLSPFMPNGFLGIIQAMGFSFIALQGFDLIAAVAGEIKEPSKNIPRAMVLSLVIALLIYIPLLFIVTTVGLPEGGSIVSLSEAQPEAVVAVAAQQFMGGLGYWLVIIAALLAMLSALQANIFAASRIAFAMAKDRTLAARIGHLNQNQMPAPALWLSSLTLIVLLIIIPDVAAAGAAASLIFLISFALVHGISILAKLRSSGSSLPFELPFFPLIPLIGGLACLALAVFQGIVVPSAGFITLLWLIIGLTIYTSLFAAKARVADATAEALDPSLIQYRGRSPLVLLPIANPQNAAALIEMAHTMSPQKVGRVLLLSVVRPPNGEALEEPLANTQAVLGDSLMASFKVGLSPEALTTLAADPWKEMARVAKLHRCESMLLGFSELTEQITENRLGDLLAEVDCDVAILRAPNGWSLANSKRILVPVAGGSSYHDALRARLLASLQRISSREIKFLRVVPTGITEASLKRAQKALEAFASQEVWAQISAEVLQSDNAIESILEASENVDLLILGSKREGRSRAGIGDFAKLLAQKANCAVLIISRQ
ncbi:MAG: amino acid permease [Trueperaceae bacterium]|nr:amino acid permease [Trueperaceae bacterium]